MLSHLHRFGPIFGEGGLVVVLLNCWAKLSANGPTWESGAALIGAVGTLCYGASSLLRELRTSYPERFGS